MKIFLMFCILTLSTALHAKMLNDVVVEVPNELVKSAKFMIVGEPGATQKESQATIFKLEVDKNNTPLVDSRIYIEKISLNKEINLVPGHYMFYWEQSLSPVLTIEPKSKSVFKLSKIIIPKQNGDTVADVFTDATAEQNLYNFLVAFWTDNSESFCKEVFKQGKENLALHFCNVRSEGNFQKLTDLFSKKVVDQHGRFATQLDINGRVGSYKYFYAAQDMSEGDFASVIPGVYGVTFKTKEGQKVTKLGIVVD
ncbi:MAG: hypothetical protein IPM57_03220 [Oligoflexia bacterium]|nr:hypothetical protein [Oligoflexia bacterium]